MKLKQALLIGLALFISKSAYSNPSECWVEDPDVQGTYEGDCVAGKANGFGVSTGKDIYKGEFKDGYLHGKGTYTWQSGRVYEGDWVDGKRTGKGKWQECGPASGCDYYEGEWLNSKFNGFGTFSYRCNCKFIGCQRCTDHGLFEDGKLIESAPSDVTSIKEFKAWKMKESKKINAYEDKVRSFRSNLSVGDDSSVGIIIEVKENIVKVQTNDSQCTQRNNDGDCLNWITTPVEKWFKKNDIYPRD